MPPLARQIPRFIADSPVEGLPYGHWGEQLAAAFAKAAEPHHEEAGGPPGEINWYPERTWGGRVYVPATAHAQVADGAEPSEYFGYVSFTRGEDGAPGDVRAVADSTDVLAAQNSGWRIDINEEVIGKWKAEGDRWADVTLVWGTPMVRGAIAATAELDGEISDQASVVEERFTLITVDALRDRGDDLYTEIKLWGKRGAELAAESLYEAPE